MRRVLVVAGLILVCLTGLQAGEADPWAGKNRTDVVMLLGEPNKTKSANGGEILTYKLVRLDEGAMPPVGMRVLGVPGIRGLVGTRTPSGAINGDEVAINPTEVDGKGRGTGGGVEIEESSSISWNTKDKQLERSWEDRPATRGKLTLKFHVSADGTIETWSMSPKKAATDLSTQPTPSTPTPEQLANLTYYDVIVAEPVELLDGHWVGPPFVEGGSERPMVELIREPVAFGDLNGDGADDAAVLLAESSGGSGTRIWVSTAGVLLDRPTCFGSALVGDRPQIRSMQIDKRGWIRLEVVDAGPRDPVCCPTKLWTKEWALVEGELMQVSALMGESLSVGLLAGQEWILTHFDVDEPVSPAPRITARFEAGELSGSSGCNSYFAETMGQQPGVIAFGAVGATRRACLPNVMSVEQKFLSRLGLVTRYGFRMGRLALFWQDGERSGAMLFTSSDTKDGEVLGSAVYN
jgi:heat shock protein HslJ